MSNSSPKSAPFRTAPSAPNDAIALLEGDHRKVEKLFEKFEKSKGAKAKGELAQEICKELNIHHAIEEEIFYPQLKEYIDEKLYAEAFVEHDSIKVLIAEIMASSPEDEFYDAKVKVLSETLEHHIKEEEERDGVFAQAKRGGGDLKAIGKEMAAKKEELSAQFDRDGIPPPEMKVMTGGEVTQGSMEGA